MCYESYDSECYLYGFKIFAIINCMYRYVSLSWRRERDITDLSLSFT